MSIIEWIVWGIGVLILIAYSPWYFMHDRYSFLARLIKQFAVLLTIGLVVTVLTDISKLHLLWWIPVSYILPHYFSFWRLKIKRFLRGETPAYRKKLKGY